jgi:hypothetical protein
MDAKTVGARQRDPAERSRHDLAKTARPQVTESTADRWKQLRRTMKVAIEVQIADQDLDTDYVEELVERVFLDNLDSEDVIVTVTLGQ